MIFYCIKNCELYASYHYKSFWYYEAFYLQRQLYPSHQNWSYRGLQEKASKSFLKDNLTYSSNQSKDDILSNLPQLNDLVFFLDLLPIAHWLNFSVIRWVLFTLEIRVIDTEFFILSMNHWNLASKKEDIPLSSHTIRLPYNSNRLQMNVQT
jgi:hypothetical protein